jgi:hypothetical protein
MYFALVFAAGFALGVFRNFVLVPLAGELNSVVIEMPVMLALSWWACKWVMRHFRVPGTWSSRSGLGGIAFLLLMVAELMLSTLLFGNPVVEHFAKYGSWPGALGLFGQLLFAAFPEIQRWAEEHRGSRQGRDRISS